MPILAQATARSRRSLPQNNSPSAVVKLGAPKMPSCFASPVCVRNAALIVSARAASNTGAAKSNQKSRRGGITLLCAFPRTYATPHARMVAVDVAIAHRGPRDVARWSMVASVEVDVRDGRWLDGRRAQRAPDAPAHLDAPRGVLRRPGETRRRKFT